MCGCVCWCIAVMQKQLCDLLHVPVMLILASSLVNCRKCMDETHREKKEAMSRAKDQAQLATGPSHDAKNCLLSI